MVNESRLRGMLNVMLIYCMHIHIDSRFIWSNFQYFLWIFVSIDLHMCHHVSMYLDSSTICVTCYLDSKSMDSNQKSQNPLCNGLGTIPTPFRTVQAARTMLGQMPWRPCSNASGRVLRVIQRSWRLSGCCQRTQFFQTFHIGGGLLSKTPFVEKISKAVCLGRPWRPSESWTLG